MAAYPNSKLEGGGVLPNTLKLLLVASGTIIIHKHYSKLLAISGKFRPNPSLYAICMYVYIIPKMIIPKVHVSC